MNPLPSPPAMTLLAQSPIAIDIVHLRSCESWASSLEPEKDRGTILGSFKSELPQARCAPLAVGPHILRGSLRRREHLPSALGFAHPVPIRWKVQ